ncbi:MAG: ERF family protein [Minisyncoccia bacterium]
MSKIYGQLLQFQNKLRKVNKDAKGHNHSYASFDNVVETIDPELNSQGLGYTHTFDGQDIICTLFNAEGETITSKLTLPQESLKGMNASQSMGAAITYARRYTLTAILGLVTDDDTDGVVNTPKTKQNTSQGQNMDDNKAWLNVGTPEFEKIAQFVDKYPAEQLIKFARTKYKVSKETEQTIRALYQDNYEEVVLVD